MGILNCNSLLGLMDAAERSNMVIANNMANLNTPGYRTMRVTFAQRLSDVMDENGTVRPGQRIGTETYRPLFPDVGADGNDVSLGREIVALNKNVLRTRLYLGVLRSRIGRLRAAIEGR